MPVCVWLCVSGGEGFFVLMCVCVGGCLSKALLVCLSMSVHVCVSTCCVHIVVWVSVFMCGSLQGSCVPMSNLFDCVSDAMSLCSYICLGICQSISALVLPVSLYIWGYVPWECLYVFLSICALACLCPCPYLSECVSLCQFRSLCWGQGQFSLYVGLPVSIHLPLSVPPACLSLFPPASSPASLPAVCVCLYQGSVSCGL